MSLGGNLEGGLNPDDLQKYVGDVNYPTNKDELASKAEQNGAPQEMVDQIRGLDKNEISSLGDLQSSLNIL